MTHTSSTNHKPPRVAFGIISFMWARPLTNADFDLVDRAHTLGFDAFELVMPEPEAIDVGALGERIKARGLVSALTARVDASTDPCSDDADVRERARSYLRYCIEVASHMGASVVGGPLLGSPLIFAGRRPRMFAGGERRERFERSVRHLTEMASFAQERGVKLALEPVNRFETDTVNLVEQALELITAISAGNTLGVLLDTFHANIEEASIPKAIELAGPHLIHVHANENHRGIIGSGHLPWPEIMRALERVHFQGQVVLEPFRRSDNGFSVPLAFWRPPQPDEDQQAAESLAYLKSLLSTRDQSL